MYTLAYGFCSRYKRIRIAVSVEIAVFSQRRSQDFFWGGGPPGTFSSPLREPTAFSGGGGGVAEIFRDLNTGSDIQLGGGGGGSSINFSR